MVDPGLLARTAARLRGTAGLVPRDDAPENIGRVKHGLGILADNAAAEVADRDVRDHPVVRVGALQ